MPISFTCVYETYKCIQLFTVGTFNALTYCMRIDKIVISTDHKTATIYYTTGRMVDLYSDIGKVEDLIAIIYSPLSKVDSWSSLIGSFEDTLNIAIDDIA